MSFDYQTICAVLYREARLLDDRQWDEWLACYAEDVTYWMPAWDDDDQLTDDHESQISLMYYPDRGGLEDRVFRIKTERSGASMPEPRTSHNVTNVEVLAERDNEVDVRYNFNTLNHRYKFNDHFFGTMFVTLRKVDDALLISSKRIVLKTDYIRQVLDVYHV
jgi:benzoate/toluate 1,2-dioxygenase beta subunit